MADYRDHYFELESAGASPVAVSVDPPEISEALRKQLSLPFPILCDTERQVVRDWDIFNAREHGGIAKPAVFVIDPNRVVQYSSVDLVPIRIRAANIVQFLQNTTNADVMRRRVFIPRPPDWLHAISNNFRK